jgi:hypothetical protein
VLIDQKFPDKKEIGLACCGDWHIGAQTCNEKAVDKWLNAVKQNKWYVLLMGDLTENATRGSVGAVFEQRLTPQEQVKRVIELLTPIKDYIIGGVSGNHGYRTVKECGIDPDEIISWELGVPHFGYTAQGRINVGGETNWKIVAHHGAGGGVLQGSKLNMIKKLAAIYPMADLYMAGHTHSDVAGSDRVIDISMNRGIHLVYKTRHFSGTGSLLDYDRSYAEQKLYPPASLAQVVHFLGSREHKTRDSEHPEKYIKPYRRIVHYF